MDGAAGTILNEAFSAVTPPETALILSLLNDFVIAATPDQTPFIKPVFEITVRDELKSDIVISELKSFKIFESLSFAVIFISKVAPA